MVARLPGRVGVAPGPASDLRSQVPISAPGASRHLTESTVRPRYKGIAGMRNGHLRLCPYGQRRPLRRSSATRSKWPRWRCPSRRHFRQARHGSAAIANLTRIHELIAFGVRVPKVSETDQDAVYIRKRRQLDLSSPGPILWALVAPRTCFQRQLAKDH